MVEINYSEELKTENERSEIKKKRNKLPLILFVKEMWAAIVLNILISA